MPFKAAILALKKFPAIGTLENAPVRYTRTWLFSRPNWRGRHTGVELYMARGALGVIHAVCQTTESKHLVKDILLNMFEFRHRIILQFKVSTLLSSR
jgi:hypothetical protein